MVDLLWREGKEWNETKNSHPPARCQRAGLKKFVFQYFFVDFSFARAI
jgi:hypothetical protein